jgi:hypothetical protein
MSEEKGGSKYFHQGSAQVHTTKLSAKALKTVFDG